MYLGTEAAYGFELIGIQRGRCFFLSFITTVRWWRGQGWSRYSHLSELYFLTLDPSTLIYTGKKPLNNCPKHYSHSETKSQRGEKS